MTAAAPVASLRAHLARQPWDCNTRARLAHALLRQDDLGDAFRLLKQPGCPRNEPERGRWLLLQALVARARGFESAYRTGLTRFAAVPRVYTEDLQLWRRLRRQTAPSAGASLGLRLDLSSGYTSNALAGVPIDPSGPGTDSPFARVELGGRLVLPRWGRIRPTAEALVIGHALSDADSQQWSSLQGLVRPGVLLGSPSTQVLLAYRADLYLLNQDDGVPFSHAHRAEAEVELGRLLLFGNAGVRWFAEAGRTRFETDGGLGQTFPVARRLQLVVAATGRYHLADDVAYDLVGATGLVHLRLGLPAGARLQAGGTIGYDYYPSSGGAEGVARFGVAVTRSDVLTTATGALWSPAWRGWRAGVAYDLAVRESNVETADRSFGYREHRVTARLRWVRELDPTAPRAAAAKRFPLDYGIATDQGSMEEERIQDLLRQDEADRRSSCGCSR